MKQALTPAHHQWIRDLSGGAMDPEKYHADDRGSAGSEADAADPASTPGAPLVELQKSRIVWRQARDRIIGELDQLRDAVLDMMAEDPELDEIINALEELNEVSVRLDTRLIDKLDDALTETDPQRRVKLHEEARGIVDAYLVYASHDPIFSQLDGATPFGMSLSAASLATSTLKSLRAALR